MRRSCSMTITAPGREVLARQRERRRAPRDPTRYGGSTNTSRHGAAGPWRRGERDGVAGDDGRAVGEAELARGCRGSRPARACAASTNVACAAPRDSASMPERARAGEQVEDVVAGDRAWPRMLKIASRTFSEVGRVAAPARGAQRRGRRGCRRRSARVEDYARSFVVAPTDSLTICRACLVREPGGVAARRRAGKRRGRARRAARGRPRVDVRRARRPRSRGCRRRCAGCGSRAASAC